MTRPNGMTRSLYVRHDGLNTDTHVLTTPDGAQRYDGALVDNHPDGTFTVRGPAVVRDEAAGTFHVEG